MKKLLLSRQELATHEAGHLVAIVAVREFKPAHFIWHRLPAYEIAHVEPIAEREFDWEDPADRNKFIVKRVVIALAGGVAADLCAPLKRQENYSLRNLYDLIGSIDFELAHEWLTLQRYDPDQRSIEQEIERLFLELRDFMALPVQQTALNTIAGRLLDYLQHADAAGADFVELPTQQLLGDVVIEQSREFTLKTTLLRNSRAAR
jgi:hypothetical protein